MEVGKTFMPISVDVSDKDILLIGGSALALHKIESLRKFTNNIVIVAKRVSTEIKEMGYRYWEKDYEPSDLKHGFIIYACTSNMELNKQIKSDGTELGKLVNVVDKPDMCDFVSPAIYRKSYMSVAVSSNGQNVYKSIRLRNKIKNLLDEDLEFLAELEK